MDPDSRSGVKAVRPWSRPGERYAGHRWPLVDGSVGGRTGYSTTQSEQMSPAPAVLAALGVSLTDLSWDTLVTQIEPIVTGAGFAERELNPLLQLGEQLRRARGAVLSRVKRHTWRAPLERALRAATERRLLAAETPERISAWCAEVPEDAREALRALWADVGLSPADHLGLFLHTLPPRVARAPGERLALATLLLGAVDPMGLPPLTSAAYGGASSSAVDPVADAGLAYRSWLGALDELTCAAERRGIALPSRLHAAAILRAFAPTGRTEPRQSAKSGVVRETTARALALDAHPAPTTAPSLADLARTLLIEESELTKIVRLLDDRGQVVFYGPPGTGKTHVARALARHLSTRDENVHVLQFHPSYAYEDFVEGFRPAALEDGAAGFALQDGPLKQIARAAHLRPAERFVLVIDELNRANVSKVFGELYFLLEYREQSLRLQYSQAPFSLPRNLSIIATMNAADRSIALVDLALRRRFYFVPFYPDASPVQGLLRRWLTAHQPDFVWVADVVDRANERLTSRHDRHAAIGPSHFMRSDLTEEWVAMLWEHSVLPTIAELFFGDEAAVDEFRLERLRPLQRKQPVPRGLSASGAKRRAPARAH